VSPPISVNRRTRLGFSITASSTSANGAGE
jgi:hypothetical protein